MVSNIKTYPFIFGSESYFFCEKVKVTHGYIRSEYIYPTGARNRYTQNIAISPERVEVEVMFAGENFETKYRNFYKNVVLNSKPQLLVLPFLNLSIPDCIVAKEVQTTANNKEFGLIKCNVVFIAVSKNIESFNIIEKMNDLKNSINKIVDKVFNLYKYINLALSSTQLLLAYVNDLVNIVKSPVKSVIAIKDKVETKKLLKDIINNGNEDYIEIAVNEEVKKTNNFDEKSSEFFINYKTLIDSTIFYKFCLNTQSKVYSKSSLYDDLLTLDYKYSKLKNNISIVDLQVFIDNIYEYTYTFIVNTFSSIVVNEVEIEDLDYYLYTAKLYLSTERLPELLSLNKTTSLYKKNGVLKYLNE